MCNFFVKVHHLILHIRPVRCEHRVFTLLHCKAIYFLQNNKFHWWISRKLVAYNFTIKIGSTSIHRITCQWCIFNLKNKNKIKDDLLFQPVTKKSPANYNPVRIKDSWSHDSIQLWLALQDLGTRFQ